MIETSKTSEVLIPTRSRPSPSGQIYHRSLERDAGAEGAFVAHIFLLAVGLDLLVVADDLDHGVAAFLLGAILQCQHGAEQGIFAALLVRFAQKVRLPVHRPLADRPCNRWMTFAE